MNDLISRQALCEYALNQKDKSVTPNDIMRFPSAQLDVVRCKNCKHWMTAYLSVCGKHGCNVMHDYTAPDDYCFKADMRGGEE